MDKKKTLKEMREEIKQMVEASQRRQKGEKVTSEDIKKNPIGTRAKSVKAENFRTDIDTGMKSQKSKDYSKSKTSGTYMDADNKPNPPKSKRDEKPRQRRGAGREDMMSNQRQREIMEREERKRKNNMDKGGSNVVGS
jgi:hypothetical protein